MQTFVGMILGILLLVCGVYIYDSIQTSSIATGQVAQTNRTLVNWDGRGGRLEGAEDARPRRLGEDLVEVTARIHSQTMGAFVSARAPSAL